MENKNEGAYIFLSHSHKDLAKVRKIRNAFEDIGCNPIMLYLHGIKNRMLIKSIIKAEIDAREWFVYCDSDASADSEWVQWERDYAKKKKGKLRAFTLDINKYSEREIEEKLGMIKKYTTVYVSYSSRDKDIAKSLEKTLSDAAYQVLTDDDIIMGTNYMEQLAAKVKAASEKGFVILLITENSMKSDMVKNEIHYAWSLGGMVVPVMVGDNVELPLAMKYILNGKQMLHIPGKPKDSDFAAIIDKLYSMTEFNV